MHGSSSAIPGFIALVMVATALSGVTAITRRAHAQHRARLVAAGYVENNRPWRLRQDQYKRIFLIAYVVFGCITLYLAPTNREFGYGRQAALLNEIETILFVSVSAFIPAVAVWGIVRYLTELFHPIGVVALIKRTNEFHKRSGTLQTTDLHGNQKIVQPWEIGLTPMGWGDKKTQPIVIEGER